MDAEEGFDAMEGMDEGRKGSSSSSSDGKGSNGDELSPPSDSNVNKRKSPSGAEKSSSMSGRADKLPENETNKVAPRKSKKAREEIEDLHAETQRLLRETPGASFVPEQAMKKPVSSLIEKIRQRKLQLSNSLAKCSTSTLRSTLKITLEQKHVLCEGTVDDEIEFVMSKPPIRLVVKQEPGEPSTSGVPRDEPDENPIPVDDMDDAGDGLGSQPRTPDIQLDRSNSNSGCKSPPKSFLRAPLLESQDLYSDSQLSLKDDSQGDDEDVIPVVANRMNLHRDSETQDDDRWLEEDVEKENRDPSVRSLPEIIPIVADVRGLVDDEAEDEDEEDDSLDDEDDEGQETAGELHDLLTQDAGEKLADVERRAELHSKWLEQQDLAMEDNILQRIETGWKTKGKKEMPALLSDSQDRPSKGDTVVRPFGSIGRLGEPASGGFGSTFEVLSKQDDDRLLETAKNSGSTDQDSADPTQQDDYQESSDDEEAEENLRRQLFLQESEEKIEFLSVADDESSREILGLINKVNVAAIKPRTTTVHNEARSSGTIYHQPPSLQHQSSFLRRKVTTVSATTRQGSGSSRSYVFGRDDSNSRDSRDASRLDDKEQTGRANVVDAPKANSNFHSTQKGASSRPKSSLPKETKLRGPSLFQVLKQQAAELASGKIPLDLSGSSSRGDNLSIFLPMKPSKQPKGSRGR